MGRGGVDARGRLWDLAEIDLGQHRMLSGRDLPHHYLDLPLQQHVLLLKSGKLRTGPLRGQVSVASPMTPMRPCGAWFGRQAHVSATVVAERARARRAILIRRVLVVPVELRRQLVGRSPPPGALSAHPCGICVVLS